MSGTPSRPTPAPRPISIPGTDEADTLELAPMPHGLLASAAELGLSEAHLGRYKGLWTQRGHRYDLLKYVLALDASAVEHQELRAAPAHDRLIEMTKALRVF